MAENIWIAQRAMDCGDQAIDDICMVIINADSAQTAAQVRATAATVCVAAGHAVPSNYFTSAESVGATPAGNLSDDGDAYIVFGRTVQQVVGA